MDVPLFFELSPGGTLSPKGERRSSSNSGFLSLVFFRLARGGGKRAFGALPDSPNLFRANQKRKEPS